MNQNDRRTYELPTFRRMIKAIGDKDFKNTAYRYEIAQFNPNGTFQILHDVWIEKTEMRGPDGPHGNTRLYEMQNAGVWTLISMDEFYVNKTVWDNLRRDLGYSPVNEMGEGVNYA